MSLSKKITLKAFIAKFDHGHHVHDYFKQNLIMDTMSMTILS